MDFDNFGNPHVLSKAWKSHGNSVPVFETHGVKSRVTRMEDPTQNVEDTTITLKSSSIKYGSCQTSKTSYRLQDQPAMSSTARDAHIKLSPLSSKSYEEDETHHEETPYRPRSERRFRTTSKRVHSRHRTWHLLRPWKQRTR